MDIIKISNFSIPFIVKNIFSVLRIKIRNMILFVDMDEVIADTYGAHIEIYNAEFNQRLCAEICLGHEVWQKVPKEHQESIRQHARRKGFFRDLKPIKGSQEVLKDLSLKNGCIYSLRGHAISELPRREK
jgi:5'(3')-deoxyribonucleotidase